MKCANNDINLSIGGHKVKKFQATYKGDFHYTTLFLPNKHIQNHQLGSQKVRCNHYPTSINLLPSLPSFTFYPSPFTFHPSPSTLHLPPFTFHPSPFILHPKFFSLIEGVGVWYCWSLLVWDISFADTTFLATCLRPVHLVSVLVHVIVN